MVSAIQRRHFVATGLTNSPETRAVNNGFRQISLVENLGMTDYDGLQTLVRWQHVHAFASVS